MGKNGIIYIGGFELPDKNAAAHRVINNGKIFRTLGYEVIFSGVDKDLPWNSDIVETYIEGFKSNSLPYPRTVLQYIRWTFSFEKIHSVLESHEDNVWLVVAYNMHAYQLWMLKRYCNKKNIKIIADRTEWYGYKFSLLPRKMVMWIDDCLTMRILQKHLDGMIVISDYLKDYYQKSVKKLIVIPPLIDIEDWKWKQSAEIKYKDVEFIYAGSPGKNKDRVDKIIQCFYDLKDSIEYHFTIIGITKERFFKLYPHMKDIVWQLKDRIIFEGQVSHEDSIRMLKRADYCIFIRENRLQNKAGFPTKFVECYTAGINIITNDMSDIKKYFPINQSFLIDEPDQKKIREILKSIMADDIEKVRSQKRDGSTDNPFDYRKWVEAVEDFLAAL